MNDPIAAPIQALLDLFAAELPEVKFPELDAAILASSARQTLAAAESVARAEAALEADRLALAEAQEALLQKAQRALAYARIYTEDVPELAARLEAIALPRTPRRPLAAEPMASAGAAAPRRRGRPPKVRDAESASLFEGAPAELSVEAFEQLG